MIRLEKPSRTSKVSAWPCALNRPTGGVSPASKETTGSREPGLRCFNFRRRECGSPDFRLLVLWSEGFTVYSRWIDPLVEA